MTDETWDRIRRQQLDYEIRQQCGVVTWPQLREGGWGEETIRRAVRRRDITRIYPRVYAHNVGALTLAERQWAATLWAAPAAIVPDLATVHDGEQPIRIAVARNRRLSPPTGLLVHRLEYFTEMVHPLAQPPRLKFEHALLVRISKAAGADEVASLLSDGIGRRGVTALHVRSAMALHPRLPRGKLVRAILTDIETGTESVLERAYLQGVERAHGLPTPKRQSPRPGERRDMEYAEFGLVIELDGRFAHDSWSAGNRDARRDLADVAAGLTPLRLRWQQAMITPCETAGRIAMALQRRGWSGAPHRCGPRCTLPERRATAPNRGV